MSSLQSRPKPGTRLEYPRLAPFAPVIRRATNEIQVGIDPDNALVFRGSGFTELMNLLNGSRPTSAIKNAGRAAGLTMEQVTGMAAAS